MNMPLKLKLISPLNSLKLFSLTLCFSLPLFLSLSFSFHLFPSSFLHVIFLINIFVRRKLIPHLILSKWPPSDNLLCTIDLSTSSLTSLSLAIWYSQRDVFANKNPTGHLWAEGKITLNQWEKLVRRVWL